MRLFQSDRLAIIVCGFGSVYDRTTYLEQINMLPAQEKIWINIYKSEHFSSRRGGSRYLNSCQSICHNFRHELLRCVFFTLHWISIVASQIVITTYANNVDCLREMFVRKGLSMFLNYSCLVLPEVIQLTVEVQHLPNKDTMKIETKDNERTNVKCVLFMSY